MTGKLFPERTFPIAFSRTMQIPIERLAAAPFQCHVCLCWTTTIRSSIVLTTFPTMPPRPRFLWLNYCQRCGMKTWKNQRIIDISEMKKMPTADYIPKKIDAKKQAWSWGLATTGCLGNASFLEPDRSVRPKPHYKPMEMMPKPHRVPLFKEFEVRDIAAGHGFSLFAAKSNETDYTIFGCGINPYLQLGRQEFQGKRMDCLIVPVPIPLPLNQKEKVVKVAAGRNHSLALTTSGEVLTFGNNCYGQLGREVVDREDYRESGYIHRIKLPDPITEIVCGQDHSLFLTDKGEVYSCGLGADGQTGLGTYENVGPPEKITGELAGQKVVHVSGSADTVLAVTEDGNLFGWGNNEYFQFSMTTSEAQVNQPIHLPLKIGKILKASAGGSSCIVINENHEVFVWGFGILGRGPKVTQSPEPSQLPNPLFACDELNPENRVVDVFAGLRHFSAVTSLGDLFSWGKNRHGCLGLGGRKRGSQPGDQYFPFRVDLPAHAIKVSMGVDHTLVMSRTFI